VDCVCARGGFHDFVLGPPVLSWCTLCPRGETTVDIAALDHSACFGCSNGSATQCACPLGWYVSVASADDTEDLATCNICPAGMTTVGTEAVGIEDCICPTASFLVVTSVGVDAGERQCVQCPADMTTASPGALSISECYCQPGAATLLLHTQSPWLGAFGTCVPCKLHTYNSNTSLRGSKCTPCPRDTGTLATSSDSILDCVYYMPDIRVTVRPKCLLYLSSELAAITTVRGMLNSLATWHNSDRVIVLHQSPSRLLNRAVLQATCAASPGPCTWSPVNQALSLNITTVYRITGRGDTTIFESGDHRLATTLEPAALCAA